jgi:hypothetical protein
MKVMKVLVASLALETNSRRNGVSVMRGLQEEVMACLQNWTTPSGQQPGTSSPAGIRAGAPAVVSRLIGCTLRWLNHRHNSSIKTQQVHLFVSYLQYPAAECVGHQQLSAIRAGSSRMQVHQAHRQTACRGSGWCLATQLRPAGPQR